MFWLKHLAVIIATLCAINAYANEGAAPAGGGHDAKPAEGGGGEHGGAKASAKEVEYSGAQNEEWSKAQKDLQTAKIKFDNDKKIVEDLKHSAEMQENLSKESLAKINEATKTMKTSEANYLRLLNQYDLRFPEKGLVVGRKYKRSDSERDGIETVEEKPQGVEAKLRRLNRNIKRQYLTEDSANSTSGTTTKKPTKKQTSDDSSETSPHTEPGDVTGTITIEK